MTIFYGYQIVHRGQQSQLQWRTLDTREVDDVTARRSKMYGEFVSLKQRPMTSRAVCYRIELAVAKFFMPG